MKIKNKYKVWDKVRFRHSNSNIVYEVYAIQVYKKWRIWYNLYYDSTHEIADEYQIKKYKKTSIWLTTNSNEQM